jgi:hypothetical protein
MAIWVLAWRFELEAGGQSREAAEVQKDGRTEGAQTRALTNRKDETSNHDHR